MNSPLSPDLPCQRENEYRWILHPGLILPDRAEFYRLVAKEYLRVCEEGERETLREGRGCLSFQFRGDGFLSGGLFPLLGPPRPGLLPIEINYGEMELPWNEFQV